MEIGNMVTVNAKVKKHDERDGIKQTIITRCTTWVSPEEKKAAAAERKAARKAQEE